MQNYLPHAKALGNYCRAASRKDYVYTYVCIYVSRLGMCALRANVRITCVCVTHRNVAC